MAVSFFPYQTNAVRVANLLLNHLGVKVSAFTLQKELVAHPEYPSMLAMSDCLSEWRVANEAFMIEKSLSGLRALPLPFIAHSETAGGRFYLISEITSNYVIYSDEQQKNRRRPLEDFIEEWDGVVLLAEALPESGESDYRLNKRKSLAEILRFPFLSLALLFCISSLFYSLEFDATISIQLTLAMVGACTCSALVAIGIFGIRGNLSKLCRINDQNGCENLMEQPAAYLFGWIGWSEVGLFYFCGYLLSLMLVAQGLSLISLLPFLCLPYTFYSIYYQNKSGQWCLMCCIVQAVIFMQAIAYLFIGGNILNVVLPSGPAIYFQVLSCFLSVVISYVLLKPLIMRAKDAQVLELKVKMWKYNRDLFNNSLKSGPRYIVPEGLSSYSFNNIDVDYEVVVVGNPLCLPCQKAHELFTRLYAQSDKISIHFVFASSDDPGNLVNKIATRILSLSYQDVHLADLAMNDWYSKIPKTYEEWLFKFPTSIDDKAVATLNMQRKWCKAVGILGTPTVLVNGYKLPNQYQIEDMKYLLNL